MVDVLARKKQDETGMKLLWGTANLFSTALHGRRGHESRSRGLRIRRTQVQGVHGRDQAARRRELRALGRPRRLRDAAQHRPEAGARQLGRFLQLVVEHKHKIGFKGTILIEPKPHEPTKHQYDFDTATVYGFLQKHGLENEVKVNIEANHATLAGHSFEHEIATAAGAGHLRLASTSTAATRRTAGTPTSSPTTSLEMALAMYRILQGGGFTTGGFNFDAKVRRQSIDPADMFYGHVGGMDLCARALLAAEQMIADGGHARFLADRYAGWRGPLGERWLGQGSTLEDAAAHALERNVDERPVSGQQERLENWFNRFGG